MAKKIYPMKAIYIKLGAWGKHEKECIEIKQILKDVPEYEPHPLGYPYLNAYQIAIEFHTRHPDIVAKTTYKVGGAGTGDRNSLS